MKKLFEVILKSHIAFLELIVASKTFDKMHPKDAEIGLDLLEGDKALLESLEKKN